MKKTLIIQVNILLVAYLLLLSTSCHIPAKIIQPEKSANLPTSYFQNTTDTSSIASTPWKSFFTDPILQQLIDTAIVNNIDILSNDQLVNIAHTNLRISKALTLPTLDAVLNTQVDRYAFYTMNGIGNFDLNKSNNISPNMRIPNAVPDVFIGLRSQWEIDMWGKMKNLKKAALSRYLSSVQGKLFLQTNIVADVANYYYELLGLDVEIEVVKKNIQFQQTALDIVKAQKEGGRATELAVLQFQALLHKTKGIEYGIRQQIAETENKLNLLLGRYPQPIKRGTSLSNLYLPQNIKTGIPANLLYNRPDVGRAIHELTGMYADVAAARALFFPAFNITPYIGFQGFRLPAIFDAQSIATGIAANFVGPLFNKRKIKGNYNVTIAQTKQALLNYTKTLQTAVMEVQTNMQSIQNLQQQYSFKQQEVKELTTAIETANDLYSNGFANYLEVITAQKSLVEAEIELTLLKKVQFQATVNLYRATGGGWR
jgi:outer membrane protein, multidrug efflux system